MNKSDFSFTEKQLDIAATLTTISSLLSLFGGLAIIWSYSRIVEIQNRVRELLVCLTIADICTAFGNGLGSLRWFNYGRAKSEASENLCIGQSFLTTMSSLMSFNWTTAIAVYLFISVWFHRNPKFEKKWYLLMHILLWGVPGAITLAALSLNYLGLNGNRFNGVWCWLNLSSDTTKGKIWLFISGKGWELLTYLTITVLYILMKIETGLQRKRHEVFYWHHINHDLRREDELYCFSFLILYCLRFWGTFRFLVDIATSTSSWYDTNVRPPFLYLQSCGDSGQAFLNFILYCVCDATVRSYICVHVFKRQDDNCSFSGNINSSVEETGPLLNTI